MPITKINEKSQMIPISPEFEDEDFEEIGYKASGINNGSHKICHETFLKVINGYRITPW